MDLLEVLFGSSGRPARLLDAAQPPTLHVAADLLIAGCYAAIGSGIFWLLHRRPDLFAAHRVRAWLFGLFVLAGGLPHLVDALTVWHPIPGIAKGVAAAVSLITVVAVWPLLRGLVRAPAPWAADVDCRMGREADARQATLHELEAAHRELERRDAERTREAAEVKARFETALRGGKIYAFAQDKELRYTWACGPSGDDTLGDLIGRTDQDILPATECDDVVALKRRVIATGTPADCEVVHSMPRGRVLLALHVEPTIARDRQIEGVTCAAVDITEQRQGEAHLRLLMRELTHRSKNLLAVIQAMARQTARHAFSTEQFLDQFGARLQALAASHDLLVQESWYGASLPALARLQLGPYLEGPRPQISIDGPPVLLRPEAAQSLGLALHELATNAAKYGALSVPGGHVDVTWHRRDEPAGDGIEISWAESRGPQVAKPERRGFGSLVVEKNLARALDADVSLDFDPAGVRCRIVIPPEHVLTRAG